jgi:hypothetical protein
MHMRAKCGSNMTKTIAQKRVSMNQPAGDFPPPRQFRVPRRFSQPSSSGRTLPQTPTTPLSKRRKIADHIQFSSHVIRQKNQEQAEEDWIKEFKDKFPDLHKQLLTLPGERNKKRRPRIHELKKTLGLRIMFVLRLFLLLCFTLCVLSVPHLRNYQFLCYV